MPSVLTVRRFPTLKGVRIAMIVGLVVAFQVSVPEDVSAQDDTSRSRRLMVEQQIEGRGIDDPRVLSAMAEVPRHLFAPLAAREHAYLDQAVPIGQGQTILQPYLVALMSDLLDLEEGDRVLEIGTGSGYQAAVLSRLAGEVYTVEILDHLAQDAARTLTSLGYENVRVRIGDGYKGWPEAAPFDAILVTAAPSRVPPPLLEQLKVGGRMVIPVGSVFQDLQVITKTPDGDKTRKLIPVRFEPMTGAVRGD